MDYIIIIASVLLGAAVTYIVLRGDIRDRDKELKTLFEWWQDAEDQVTDSRKQVTALRKQLTDQAIETGGTEYLLIKRIDELEELIPTECEGCGGTDGRCGPSYCLNTHSEI